MPRTASIFHRLLAGITLFVFLGACLTAPRADAVVTRAQDPDRACTIGRPATLKQPLVATPVCVAKPPLPGVATRAPFTPFPTATTTRPTAPRVLASAARIASIAPAGPVRPPLVGVIELRI